MLWSLSQKPFDKIHLFSLKQLRKSPVYLFRVQVQAQLSNDQTPSGFQQPPVSAKEFQEIMHEDSEVTLFRTGGNLGNELEVVLYHFFRGIRECL